MAEMKEGAPGDIVSAPKQQFYDWILRDVRETYCNFCGTPGHARIICPLRAEFKFRVSNTPNGTLLWQLYTSAMKDYKRQDILKDIWVSLEGKKVSDTGEPMDIY